MDTAATRDRAQWIRQSWQRFVQRFHFRVARSTERLPQSVGLVLIVQANGWNGESLVPPLRAAGYAARIVEEGDAALETLKDTHPLVLIVGGAADLKLYCTLRHAAAIPILALAPESDREHTLAALAAGVDDYQFGSISQREIVARVTALLRSFRRSYHTPSA